MTEVKRRVAAIEKKLAEIESRPEWQPIKIIWVDIEEEERTDPPPLALLLFIGMSTIISDRTDLTPINLTAAGRSLREKKGKSNAKTAIRKAGRKTGGN